jgi:hypothetical protein
MAKTATSKAAKSPKKAEAGKTPIGKKTGRTRKKTAVAPASEGQHPDVSGDKVEEPVADTAIPRAPGRVVWDKYPVRTERLLSYLDAHPDVAIKLFGDSTRAAKSEGRSRLTAKSNKATGYLQVAEGIFSMKIALSEATSQPTQPNTPKRSTIISPTRMYSIPMTFVVTEYLY